MAVLKKLNNKRGYLKGRVTTINKFVDAFDATTSDIIELKNRVVQIEQIINEYSGTVDKLLEHLVDEDNAIDTILPSVEDFDNFCMKTLSKLQLLIKNLEKQDIPANSLPVQLNTAEGEKQSRLNVPNIQIPVFDGAITEWLTFKDTFTAVIHNNNTLSDIEKFTHLSFKLKGDAKNTIGHITLSSAGYQKAWGDLVKRYDNKRVIIDVHLEGLFNLPNLSKDNASEYRKFFNLCVSHISSLEACGQNISDLSELMLIHLVVKKFDFLTRKEWENEIPIDQLPTWELMRNFFQKKCRVLESIEFDKKNSATTFHQKPKFSNHKPKPYLGNSSKSFLTATAQSNNTRINDAVSNNFQASNNIQTSNNSQVSNNFQCKLCNFIHHLYRCSQFLKLSVNERLQTVAKLKVCSNCLRGNHPLQNCIFQGCKYCQQKHNSLLCQQTIQEKPLSNNTVSNTNSNNNVTPAKSFCLQTARLPISIQENSESTNNNIENNSLSFSISSVDIQRKNTQITQGHKEVILPTAVILFIDSHGKPHKCRTLLDSGSNSNYISKTFAKKLQIALKPQTVPIEGLDQIRTSSNNKVTVKIKSRFNSFEYSLDFLVVSTVANLVPNNNINISPWDMPVDLKSLADPQFYVARPLDALIGAELFFKLLIFDRIELGHNLPILQDSVFGWLIGGVSIENTTKNFLLTNSSSQDDELNSSVKRFWELESIQSRTFLSKEDEECERHFASTHRRDSTGRYIVSLPLRDNASQLGDSKGQALKRFLYLERRFKQNPNLHKLYSEFMNEYMELGHMQLINESQDANLKQNFYLPHHAVIKASSSTTKLRVVFDASTKSSSDLSLNNVLMSGPIVQQDLFFIILRFRKHKFAFTTDISKMYRQIWVDEKQTSYQRILWRQNQSKPIETFELKTVTYGTAAAPYLATRVINQLATDEELHYPIAAKVAKVDFYIDDLLSGADTSEDALIIQDEMIKLLAKGGFHLHKWCSNSTKLLQNISIKDRETLNLDQISNDKTIKVLGLIWQPSNDTFLFNIKISDTSKQLTKRFILSETAKLFDPLGLLAPIIIIAKLLIQSLWRSQSNWDDMISYENQFIWNQFQSNLYNVNQFKFPRCVVPEKSKIIEIHGFADASEKAYGACVYIKSISHENKITVNLLCGKSRVSPLKVISIPRLELCAALLLSKLVNTVIEAMQIEFQNVYLWSDSTITLAWINTAPHKLKTFIANRVSEIQELTSSFIWNHVSSGDNPADLISRGIMPDQLIKMQIWWSGPQFLYEQSLFESQEFDICDFNTTLAEIKDIKVSTSFLAQMPCDILSKYSSFNKLLHIIAYCLRFIYNCKNKSTRRSGQLLTVDELQLALIHIIKLVQKSEFQLEINQLQKSQKLSNNSKIKSLNPFLDTNGVLRVGGRLNNTNLSYDVKHQFLLPAKHHVTNLIFRHEHLKNLHPGPQLLVSIIRQQFWPINAKTTAKSTVNKCITCFKVNPKVITQLMGDLPAERITPNRPFATTGVDFCGPFFIKHKYQRNSAAQKVYISCFVCFVTKAIHMEVVSDMTSEAFIACLKRFIYRRGKCVTLWSDNAKTFVGANNELRKLYELFQDETKSNSIAQFCLSEQINWKFIPPRSPNFGGLWESSVKSLKIHLKRVTSNVYMTFEELNTLIIQIEGILNSRPLSNMSTDPNDPEPLTPGHFLTGGPIIALCEPSLSLIPEHHLSKWQKITKITEDFWKRFSMEYIHSLQSRNKGRSLEANLKVGDIVLLIDENLKSTQWILGVIVDLFPGRDGIVRVVNVKTQKFTVKRAISKLCKLPI